MQLYWVTTEDHGEDWFIIGKTDVDAAYWFEREEGYDHGDAAAEFILEIPHNVQIEDIDDEYGAGWPSKDNLLAMGANFLSDEPLRVVEIAGKKYCEGMLEAILRSKGDDEFESQGLGRPNGTIPVSMLKN